MYDKKFGSNTIQANSDRTIKLVGNAYVAKTVSFKIAVMVFTKKSTFQF